MTLIDTHAHIYDDQFADDRPAMLARAQAEGVSQIWMPNCNAATLPGMLALTDLDPARYRPMIGLHPCYVTADTVEAELRAVETGLAERNYPMIGEIGLDFYWDMTFVDQQFMAFERQLRWAAARQLPVSIHVRSRPDGRNAFVEAADLIEKINLPGLPDGRRNGIFHCFVGTLADAQRAIDLGFLLGIGGVSTFKNGGLDKVLPHIDPAHVVLETDAPYLAPVPQRGKRNEPAYLPLVARRVAELMGLSVDEVARQTTHNALGLPLRPGL
jgi:TatD DNase family protein